LNHFEFDGVLVTKHGLYWSLRRHFKLGPLPDYVPETYHVVPEPESNRSSDGGGVEYVDEQEEEMEEEAVEAAADESDEAPSPSVVVVGKGGREGARKRDEAEVLVGGGFESSSDGTCGVGTGAANNKLDDGAALRAAEFSLFEQAFLSHAKRAEEEAAAANKLEKKNADNDGGVASGGGSGNGAVGGGGSGGGGDGIWSLPENENEAESSTMFPPIQASPRCQPPPPFSQNVVLGGGGVDDGSGGGLGAGTTTTMATTIIAATAAMAPNQETALSSSSPSSSGPALVSSSSSSSSSSGVSSKKGKGARTSKKGSSMVNVWIAKPAALSNRGVGIQVVSSVAEVRARTNRFTYAFQFRHIHQQIKHTPRFTCSSKVSHIL
jgi:hypothetical protein